jgi:hypothetical protein
LILKYEGSPSSFKKTHNFALVLQVPRSVIEQKHDILCSIMIEANGMDPFTVTAYVLLSLTVQSDG